ncbi:hypothetical protein LP420_27510 [Massilia sp. B-10]|nr:hypothetical protein LP420_27510 [Massilia sp. B-10]
MSFVGQAFGNLRPFLQYLACSRTSSGHNRRWKFGRRIVGHRAEIWRSLRQYHATNKSGGRAFQRLVTQLPIVSREVVYEDGAKFSAKA